MNQKGGATLPLSGVFLVTFFLGGYYLIESPFSADRPDAQKSTGHYLPTGEDIDARLWQDPMKVVHDYHNKQVLKASTQKIVSSAVGDQLLYQLGQKVAQRIYPQINPSVPVITLPTIPILQPLFTFYQHFFSRDPVRASFFFMKFWKNLIDFHRKLFSYRHKPNIRFLVVMVPGAPYAEAAEHRIRTRYAIVNALESDYRPVESQNIGYFKYNSPLQPEHKESLLVPFEWWGLEADKSKSEQHLLVLWLEEKAFSKQPAKEIRQLISKICSFKYFGGLGEKMARIKLSEPKVRVIGPSSSDTLRTLYDEVKVDATASPEDSSKTNSSTVLNTDNKYAYLSDQLARDFISSAEQLLDSKHLDKVKKKRTLFQQCIQNYLNLHQDFKKIESKQHSNLNITLVELHRALKRHLINLLIQSDNREMVLAETHKLETLIQMWIDSRKTFLLGQLELRPWEIEDIPLHFYNCRSTAERALLNKDIRKSFNDLAVENKHKITLTDTVVTDDMHAQLASETFKKLGLEPKSTQVLLVSEADTSFGNLLPKSYKNRLKSTNIETVRYLRGIDGVIPEDSSGTRNEIDKKKPKHKEYPTGNSQFDYLRSVAKQYKQQIKGANGEKAKHVIIGVLGSDIYDKLLVLQAFKPHFPKALFFTTDLDARLFHGAQRKWAHGLYAFASYDLEFIDNRHERKNCKHRKGRISFRDSYQHATFVAAHKAIESSHSEFFSVPPNSIIFQIGHWQPEKVTFQKPKNPRQVGFCVPLREETAQKKLENDPKPSFGGWALWIWAIVPIIFWILWRLKGRGYYASANRWKTAGQKSPNHDVQNIDYFDKLVELLFYGTGIFLFIVCCQSGFLSTGEITLEYFNGLSERPFLYSMLFTLGVISWALTWLLISVRCTLQNIKSRFGIGRSNFTQKHWINVALISCFVFLFFYFLSEPFSLSEKSSLAIFSLTLFGIILLLVATISFIIFCLRSAKRNLQVTDNWGIELIQEIPQINVRLRLGSRINNPKSNIQKDFDTLKKSSVIFESTTDDLHLQILDDIKEIESFFDRTTDHKNALKTNHTLKDLLTIFDKNPKIEPSKSWVDAILDKISKFLSCTNPTSKPEEKAKESISNLKENLNLLAKNDQHLANYLNKINIKAVDAYLDVQYLKEMTKVATWSIVRPAFCLFLFGAFHHRFFYPYYTDPLGKIIFVVAVLTLILIGFLIRQICEDARSQSIQTIHQCFLDVDSPQDQTRYQHLIDTLKDLKEGAFAPWSRHPVFQAFLIPFGGFGLVALLELVGPLHVLSGF